MRAIAAVAYVVPVIVVIWVLTRGPWPEPPAQAAARHAADSLAREVARVAGPAAGPAGITTGATRRGRLAWSAIEAPDARERRTVAWVRRAGVWETLLEHRSPGPTPEGLREGAAGGRFAAPPGLQPTEDRASRSLAKRFRRALPRYGRLRPDRQAIAIGPVAGERAAGDSAVTALFDDWQRRLGPPRLAAGGLRIEVPRGGGVGTVTANLEVSPPGWGGAVLPLRLTAVYRERGEESWSLVLAHLAVSAPDGAPEAPAAAR